MALKKSKIESFKIYNGGFDLELNPGLNILVGDNEIEETIYETDFSARKEI